KRVKAAFVVLVRNSDVHEMRATMRELEDRFNSKYNYPYVFLNNEPFSDEFKEMTSAMTKGNTTFGLIPKEHWGYPSWISEKKAAETREKMKSIIYGWSESYRHMCRYESGFFFRHPLMADYDYYWRVEPGVKFACDVDYDPFLMMQERNLKYGFTISIHEYRETIPTLWETTKHFMLDNPNLVAHPNTLEWVVDPKTDDYNLCHFWSNFEIGSLSWLRSKEYMAYFDYLDKAGGFFYERWGDAPVHSLAVAMFLRKDEVHWFEDIGYFHNPISHCPNDPEINRNKCHCDPTKSIHLNGWSCTKEFMAL
ncbi:nucleotide-diphospho-sugar transferase, partial [Dimargaris cristalligena]